MVQQPRQGSVGTPWDGARKSGRGGAATCQAWEPLCVYHRETVPTQNNEHALPLLNKKRHFCFLLPPKGHGVRDRESTQKPPVCRQSGLAQNGAKAEVIINRAVPS